jgi:tetratricopeptide (TPR) repeat protein
LSLHLSGPDATNAEMWSHVVEADYHNAADILGSIPALGQSIYRALENTSDNRIEDAVLTNDRARPFFITGRDLMGRRTVVEMDRAISCFEGAIREEPNSISARSLLAMAYMGKDLLRSDPKLREQALRVAREAVQIAPENSTAHRSYCAVCVSYGRYPEALEHGFRAIEYGDGSERAFGQLAYSWRMLGRPDRAIEWYRKAKVSPRQPADYEALLGDCWGDLVVDDIAQGHYESAMRFQPGNPDGWIGLCRLNLLAGRSEEARRIYHKELPHYAEFPAARQIAAMVEFFARNYAESEKLYAALQNDDPVGGGRGGSYGALDYRTVTSRLMLEAGHEAAARSLLEECQKDLTSQLREAPADAETLYRLSATQAMLNDTTAALHSLRSAVTAGWIDYRSLQLDPRFDRISSTPDFHHLTSELAAQVARLKRQSSPAGPKLVTK